LDIPTEFKIFGQTIKVDINNMLIEEEGSIGQARMRKNLIVLQCHDRLGRPDTQLEQTYLHEVLHHVLGNLGYDKLGDDELFVDQLSHALHQVLTTSVYKKKKKARK
jgi:hypothetical protein